MDGEAGWWTTSGNIGLPPLARVMGVGRQQQVVDDFKCICIIIDKHIEWTSHTESIAKKNSKYIGVTNRLKHILPLHTLCTLYNTLIHLYNCILLWGHDNTILYMLQNELYVLLLFLNIMRTLSHSVKYLI